MKKNGARLFLSGLLGGAMTIATIVVPTAALASQGCHVNDSLFDYTEFYADNARFIGYDKNGDGLLCLKNNDPHYTGEVDTLRVYENRGLKG